MMIPGVRFLSLVALAAWVGGLAALGCIAAPVLFGVLTAHDPDTGRTVAGLAPSRTCPTGTR